MVLEGLKSKNLKIKTGLGKKSSAPADLVSPANTEATDTGNMFSPSPARTSRGRRSEGGSPSSKSKAERNAESRNRLVRDVKSLPDADEADTRSILGRLVAATRSSSARSDLVEEAGGIPILLRSLARHGGSRRVAEGTCVVLQNVAVDPGHRQIIVESGGVRGIVHAMKVHHDNAAVAELGCAALRNLGSSGGDDRESSKSAVSSAGGTLALVHAMRRHSEVAAVQEQALRALRNLAKDSSANKVAIAGTIPAIIDAMASHEESEAVQREGCATLRNLSVSADNQVAVAACEGVAAIAAACLSHPRAEKVQVQGAGALFNMSFHPAALASMADGDEGGAG